MHTEEEQNTGVEKEFITYKSPLIWILVIAACATVLLYLWRDEKIEIDEKQNTSLPKSL
jgi:hypothetical protein